jgi:hypothetical protein
VTKQASKFENVSCAMLSLIDSFGRDECDRNTSRTSKIRQENKSAGSDIIWLGTLFISV